MPSSGEAGALITDRYFRGYQFWLVFGSVCVAVFLSALEVTSISTALPTISHALDAGEKFVWVGNAYTLAATAFLPLSGGLAQIWGRRTVMLGSLALFAVGAAVSGSARNMTSMIVGRTVQGIGGGGSLALADIIIADLVPLKDRGMFIGILGATWAIAAAAGPTIGGALSGKASWRWLFYLNLPLTGVAGALTLVFLKLRTPRDTLRERLRRMDWIGNLLIIAGSTSATLALTWGGIKYSWSSYRVIVALVCGFVLLAVAILYESRLSKEPTIPFDILSNRTSLSGYLGLIFHSIVATAMIYYLPVYFQACKGARPLQSSVDVFGLAFTLAPFAIVSGISTAVFHRYKPQNFIGWMITMIAMGLLSTLHANSPKREWVGYQIIAGLGLGILASSPTFPVLAPLPVEKNANALAFFAFVRSFAQTWGITIGASVMQNGLRKRLPSDLILQLPPGSDISYAIIEVIGDLPLPLQETVRDAFAESLSLLWKIMIGISGAGLLSVLLMREIPMADVVDESWGLQSGDLGIDDEVMRSEEQEKQKT